ncbi:olfactory receptor 1052-like [Tachyglossus aculeatus]|uniref:olfactory receptor 1052-like n=1 Tax=Tachyglossus aculeatus TaxID=9261 RepID=UPI0018F47DC1|nr:olfactory receptor 1052-like [Tachyglossus aculeatus]
MAVGNHTTVTEFILVGLTDRPELQVTLFMLFLAIYFVTLVGNIGMIILIQVDSRLQTTMYFFLSNLSFLDLCYATVFAPKMLVNYLSETKTISFAGCIAQCFLFIMYVSSESILLAVMAFDRYMAICNPLLYNIIVTKKLSVNLVVGSYLRGIINSLSHTGSLLRLPFCGPSVVNHYFCDVPPLLKLSCADTHINEILLFTLSGILAIITFLFIIISYIFIVATILRVPSTEGRQKAFSTCASHLTAVTLFYSSASFSYVQPTSLHSLDQEKVVAVFYTLVISMLNPLIYSLRNKDVKEALKKVMT